MQYITVSEYQPLAPTWQMRIPMVLECSWTTHVRLYKASLHFRFLGEKGCGVIARPSSAWNLYKIRLQSVVSRPLIPVNYAGQPVA